MGIELIIKCFVYYSSDLLKQRGRGRGISVEEWGNMPSLKMH